VKCATHPQVPVQALRIGVRYAENAGGVVDGALSQLVYMNTASKVGPHAQTDRRSFPGKGFEFTTKVLSKGELAEFSPRLNVKF
jgi:hypothetical protein